MITWYIILAIWIMVTTIDYCIIDCCPNRWTNVNLIAKDLCIIGYTIAIICLVSGV